MSTDQAIADHLAKIRKSLQGAHLIAVSKGQPAQAVRAALDAGQRIFGENRVQEAQGKFFELREKFPDLELHMIGPLQSNKAEDAVKLFDVIQTLDRPSLAEALARAIQKIGKRPRLYIEINIGCEPQKAGVAPEGFEDFYRNCQKLGLKISGLMCIPPEGHDPRPYFSHMHDLQKHYKLPHLSMGMSADYEIAIDCGASEVRIGTAIFGQREEI